MLKKLLCLFVALSMLIAPLQASAQDLSGTFSALLGGGSATVNSPGAFSSQARTGFSAGGVEVRVPKMNGAAPQLLSITPPTISAGCSGISAHFGGFSFISGKEFGDLLKKIASGAALGFVTSLVMKTLCPPCEAIVQELKTAAASAAKYLKDSCQWGQELGAKFREGQTGAPNKTESCATIAADSGLAGDSGSAWSGICHTINEATSVMRSVLPSGTEDEKAASKQVMSCDMGVGNITWERLKSFDMVSSSASAADAKASFDRRVLLINIMGAELGKGDDIAAASCEDGAGTYSTSDAASTNNPSAVNNDSTHFCKPPADTKLLTGLFLCGAPDLNGAIASSSASTRVKKYCSSFFGNAATLAAAPVKVWTCDTDTDCLNLRLVDASTVTPGKGFMVAVNDLLLEAVARVKASAGFDDDVGRKIIQLIQVAPYPLYQAINAAAVYPSAGTDLMDSLSILVGEQFAYSMLDEMLKLSSRNSNSMCRLSALQSGKMLDFITTLRSENQSRQELIGQNFAIQQGITRQIQEINQAIQQQTMSEDLLGATRMSQSINNAVTPMSKAAP